ncbi:MAG: FecR domain-containing protein [Spirochaetota bacterium]
MRRIPLILALAIVPIAYLSAAGTVLEASGLVELRTASGWIVLEAGDEVAVDATVATGFRSRAILRVGSSVVTVGPLSQVILNEVSVTRDEEDVSLQLPFGEIRAEVKRGSTGTDRPVNFEVLSPVSTAAVKGTVFTYDGVVLNVDEGRVDLSNAYGQWHSVGAGQESRAYRWGIESVEGTALENARGE